MANEGLDAWGDPIRAAAARVAGLSTELTGSASWIGQGPTPGRGVAEIAEDLREVLKDLRPIAREGGPAPGQS